MLVAAALDQDIEHIAILVYGPPEIVRFPVGFQVHFIQMPVVTALRPATTQFIGIRLPTFQTPWSHGFIAHDDRALDQKLLTIVKIEREAERQLNRMVDDFRWEAKAFVVWSNGGCFHEAMITYCSATPPS